MTCNSKINLYNIIFNISFQPFENVFILVSHEDHDIG